MADSVTISLPTDEFYAILATIQAVCATPSVSHVLRRAYERLDEAGRKRIVDSAKKGFEE